MSIVSTNVMASNIVRRIPITKFEIVKKPNALANISKILGMTAIKKIIKIANIQTKEYFIGSLFLRISPMTITNQTNENINKTTLNFATFFSLVVLST